MSDLRDEIQEQGIQESDEIVTKVTMEDVMIEAGVPGRYQVTHLLLTSLCLAPVSCIMFNFVFIGYEPHFKCKPTNQTELVTRNEIVSNITTILNYGSCHVEVLSNDTYTDVLELSTSIECSNGYIYNAEKYTSMVTEWDLVCSKEGTVQMVQSMMTIGSCLGSLIFPNIGDRFGRKSVFLICTALSLVFEIGLAFVPNVYIALVLRFCSGMLSAGTLVTFAVLGSELVVSKHRRVFGLLHSVLWSISLIILAGFAYLFEYNWRKVQFTNAMLDLPIIIICLFINETPTYLFAKDQHDKAKEGLQKICKFNQTNHDQVSKVYDKAVAYASHIKNNNMSDTQYTIRDIWRTKRLLVNLCILSVNWLALNLSYYGLYMTLGTLYTNRYLNFFLLTVFEIPGGLIIIPLMNIFGRRTILVTSVAFTGLSHLTASILISSDAQSEIADHMISTLFVIGSFFTAIDFSVMWLYTPEVYPTTMRSIATGIAIGVGRLSGIIAPYLLLMFKIKPWSPSAVMASVCFLGSLLALFLPETKDRQLPKTIEDVLEWYHKNGKDEKRRLIQTSSE